ELAARLQDSPVRCRLREVETAITSISPGIVSFLHSCAPVESETMAEESGNIWVLATGVAQRLARSVLSGACELCPSTPWGSARTCTFSRLCNTDVSVIFLSGPIGAGKTAVAKALSAQLPTSFLHRGRHILVLYSQRWGTRLAGQFSSAGTLDDSGGGSVCALWLPGLDRLLNTTHLHRDGTQDPE